TAEPRALATQSLQFEPLRKAGAPVDAPSGCLVTRARRRRRSGPPDGRHGGGSYGMRNAPDGEAGHPGRRSRRRAGGTPDVAALPGALAPSALSLGPALRVSRSPPAGSSSVASHGVRRTWALAVLWPNPVSSLSGLPSQSSFTNSPRQLGAVPSSRRTMLRP